VVAVQNGAVIRGITVTAFTPLSFKPPLVLVCIGVDAPVLTDIADARRFTVNVLASDQRRAASVFADRLAVGVPPFRDGDDAVLDGALTSLVCVVEEDLAGGDHRIIVGRVARIAFATSASPLLYYRRNYLALPAADRP
jgi:3-hydroxy-9,10-secoandrosta-1,3,5(10)-triene-9,17-dione monooxygenase reductase component